MATRSRQYFALQCLCVSNWSFISSSSLIHFLSQGGVRLRKGKILASNLSLLSKENSREYDVIPPPKPKIKRATEVEEAMIVKEEDNKKSARKLVPRYSWDDLVESTCNSLDEMLNESCKEPDQENYLSIPKKRKLASVSGSPSSDDFLQTVPCSSISFGPRLVTFTDNCTINLTPSHLVVKGSRPGLIETSFAIEWHLIEKWDFDDEMEDNCIFGGFKIGLDIRKYGLDFTKKGCGEDVIQIFGSGDFQVFRTALREYLGVKKMMS